MGQKKIVIAGAGIMGASLAQVYAQSGWQAVILNRSEAGLERAKATIEKDQEMLLKQGFVTEEQAALVKEQVFFTTDKACLADCSLMLETIVEELETKQAIWSEVSRLVPEDALLATNTSGLPISEIAKAVYRPERFMGQHWLNPPHLLPLCEIIRGEKTEQAYVDKMYDLVANLGKQPVIVKKDIKGFLVNRLQYAMLREALYLVECGAAELEDIDTVLKAGLGLRYAALGPFRVCDFGGLDTYDKVNRYLNETLCDRKDGDPLLAEIVEKGRWGVKTGAGFYEYPGDEARKAIDARDELYIALAKVLYYGKR